MSFLLRKHRRIRYITPSMKLRKQRREGITAEVERVIEFPYLTAVSSLICIKMFVTHWMLHYLLRKSFHVIL